jgi:hypothetical protein
VLGCEKLYGANSEQTESQSAHLSAELTAGLAVFLMVTDYLRTKTL